MKYWYFLSGEDVQFYKSKRRPVAGAIGPFIHFKDAKENIFSLLKPVDVATRSLIQKVNKKRIQDVENIYESLCNGVPRRTNHDFTKEYSFVD